MLTAKITSLNRKRILLSLLVIGPMLFSIGMFMLFYERTVLSFNKAPEVVNSQNRTKIPSRIIIDDVKIDLPVEESFIIKGIWQISKSGVSHLATSARPGEGGNTVIYGHNKKVIFGSLPYIRKGSIVEVTDESGKVFKYKVVEKATVRPDNIDFVLPKSEETLTIYTCTGFLDTMRFIAIAKPID